MRYKMVFKIKNEQKYTLSFGIFMMLIVSATYCFAQEKPSTSVDHYKTNRFDIAIFPPAKAFLISRPLFTPSREEVNKAETALDRQLKELNSKLFNQVTTPIIHKHLKKYKRQYFGYIDENNDRILFINCFWGKEIMHEKEWLKQRIMVNDGGSYYWSIKYNIKTDKLFELYVNGEG